MNSIKSGTSKLKAHFKTSIAQSTLSHERLFRSRANQSKDQNSIMEMWENYLTFTRLEL